LEDLFDVMYLNNLLFFFPTGWTVTARKQLH